MPLAIYTSAAWTANGGIEPAAGATVEVRSEATGSLVSLFEDRDGEVGLDNPFTADAQGRFAFFVSGGAYRVKVTDGENEHTLRWQAVGTAQEFDATALAHQVDSVSDLRESTFSASLERLWLSGYYGVGTPGGGPLYRDADDTTSEDNGGTVFVDADGVRWKRPESSNVFLDWFGVIDDGSPQNNAVTAAIEEAQGKTLFLNDVTIRLDETLFVPSNSKIIGAKLSVFTMLDSVDREQPVIVIGGQSSATKNVYISDVRVDFNKERWSLEGDDPSNLARRRTTLCVQHSENVVLERVTATDGYKHCFDITATTYGVGLGAETYAEERSKNVSLIDCRGWGAGDDVFTTHQSDFVSFTRCVSDFVATDTDGHVTFNSRYGFEIDDGSRNVNLTDCQSFMAAKGYDCHTSADTPAPSDIKYSGCYAEDVTVGFFLNDTNFQSLDSPSPTANNVSYVNCTVRNPRIFAVDDAPSLVRGFWIQAYSNVKITNCSAIADDDIAIEMSNAYRIADGARMVSILGSYAENWPRTNDNVNLGGYQTTSDADETVISNCIAIGCGAAAFRNTGVGNYVAWIGCVAIEGNADTGSTEGRGFQDTGNESDTEIQVIGCVSLGYPDPLRVFNTTFSTMRNLSRGEWIQYDV